VAGLARILFGPVCIGVDRPEPVLSSTIVVWRGVVVLAWPPVAGLRQ
jgi:hypothetical protein